MDIIQAISHFKNESLKPLYLLLGKEKFFHDQIMQAATERIFKDPGAKNLNYFLFYGKDNSFPEIVRSSASYPMLSDYKLVIVKEFEQLKTQDSEVFQKYIESPSASTVMILSAEQSANNAVFKKTVQSAEVIKCNPLPFYQMNDWIKNFAQSKNIKLDDSAVSILNEYVGNNLLSVQNELAKIKSYYFESDQKLASDDIIYILGLSPEYNVFKLQDALSDKNLKQSLVIFKNILETGENINLILSVLYNYFRKTLVIGQMQQMGVQKNEIMKKLTIREFQMKAFSSTYKKFGISGLEKVLHKLAEADLLIKSTSVNDSTIMERVCFTICRF